MSDQPFVSNFIAEHEAYDRQQQRQTSDVPAHVPNITIEAQEARVEYRARLSPQQREKVDSMPKKAAAYFMTLLSKGFPGRIRDAARLGMNPFPENTARAAHVAWDALMRSAGVSRNDLSVAFQTRLGWAESAAAPQVSLIWQVFQALEIACEDEYRLVAHPMLGNQTNH